MLVKQLATQQGEFAPVNANDLNDLNPITTRAGC